MTTFTKPVLRELRNQLNTVLNSNGIDGYTFELGNCKYDGGEATFQLKVLIKGSKSRQERDLEDLAKLSGLDTDKVASLQGMMVYLVGYNTKARKRPWIVAQSPKGQRYVINDYTAKRLFGTVAEVS